MGESINISEYIEIFNKRKKIVIAILLLFISAGAFLTYRHNKSYVPFYQSTISIRINTAKKAKQDNEVFGNSMANSSLNQSIAEKYSALATSKRAVSEIIEKLELQTSPEAIMSRISVVPQANILEFIDITVTDTNPELAQKIAQEVPVAFNNELKRVIGMDCVEILYNASEPSLIPKAKDNSLRNGVIGGIVVAIFIVLLLECLDNKLVTPVDAEEYWGVPVIGTIPFDKEKSKGKIKENKLANADV